MGRDDLFALYRLYRALASPEPIPLPALAKAVLAVARTKLMFRRALEGLEVRVRIENEHVQRVVEALGEIFVRYVPDDRLEDALRDLRELTAGYAGRD